jgi:hypothetical protein
MISSPVAPPPWPLIKGPQATSSMNLMEYVAMNGNSSESVEGGRQDISGPLGRVFDFDSFMTWTTSSLP